MTGWGMMEMKRANTYKGELMFSKKEVEELQTLLSKNGDTRFLYEVTKLYEEELQ